MDDGKIVDLFLQRDETAISLAQDKYGAKLKRIAFGALGDEGFAEECVNDALLAAWNRIPPNRPYDYLFAYLGRITRCIAINRAEKERAAKRSAPQTELTRELEECLPSSADVQNEVESRALGNALNAFLEGLPEEKRNVFIRRYWFFDSAERIGELTGRSAGAVKMQLSRMRGELKKYLEKEGFEV
ncbi:MAG: RNA polymerase sigma factor [Clostridia bacterium]|nr:RNA polymerase sigma factor [Clostridia bacterium]